MIPDLTALLVLLVLALLGLPKFNAWASGLFQHWVVGTIKHILKIGP